MLSKISLSFFFQILLYTALIGKNSGDSLEVKIENYIITGKNDSALNLLSNSKKGTYREVLKRMASETKPSYNDKFRFIKSVESRIQVNETEIRNLYNQVDAPANNLFSSEYVLLQFKFINHLRNANEIDQANRVNLDLTEYVALFDSSQIEVKRARLYGKVHGQVVAMIANKGEESEKLGLSILQEATLLQDTLLMIAANYHLFDSYARLDAPIKGVEVAKEAQRLDELLSERTGYYYDNLLHLADVLIYIETFSPQVLELIEKSYTTQKVRPRSYELMIKYITRVTDSVELQQPIYNLVGVTNFKDFMNVALKGTEGKLGDYDQYFVYNEGAHTAAKFGEHEVALELMSKAVKVTRKVYSEDLAKSIADYDTGILKREKELAVEYEQKQSRLYLVIASLVAVLLIIAIVAFIRKNLIAKQLGESKQKLEKVVHEKQLLLKEVHHRVKNNFQIISSLLELQSKGIKDEKAKELALEGKNRVKSMALIHQKLYQNDDLLIYFDDYINKLVKEITDMYGVGKETDISIQVPNVAFDIDTAIPLGLIVNELVTNAFKYGGVDGKNKVNISIQQQKNEGNYLLKVEDNGAGMPQGFDLKKARSMGLRLVKSLSKQLHGNVSYSNNNGAIFTVLFKNTLTRATTE